MVTNHILVTECFKIKVSFKTDKTKTIKFCEGMQKEKKSPNSVWVNAKNWTVLMVKFIKTRLETTFMRHWLMFFFLSCLILNDILQTSASPSCHHSTYLKEGRTTILFGAGCRIVSPTTNNTPQSAPSVQSRRGNMQTVNFCLDYSGRKWRMLCLSFEDSPRKIVKTIHCAVQKWNYLSIMQKREAGIFYGQNLI